MRNRHAKAAATTQTVATARASERRNGPCRVPAPHPHEVRRRQGPGEEYETQYTSKFRKHSSTSSPAHSALRSMTTTVCRSSGAPGLTASTRSGRRSGFCGTPWSRLETSLLTFVVSVDVPQIPFIERVVDISVASKRQGRTVQTVQKTRDSPGAVLGLERARRCARQGRMVQTVQSGGAAGAVPARLWMSLRFAGRPGVPALPGGASDQLIDEVR